MWLKPVPIAFIYPDLKVGAIYEIEQEALVGTELRCHMYGNGKNMATLKFRGGMIKLFSIKCV